MIGAILGLLAVWLFINFVVFVATQNPYCVLFVALFYGALCSAVGLIVV